MRAFDIESKLRDICERQWPSCAMLFSPCSSVKALEMSSASRQVGRLTTSCFSCRRRWLLLLTSCLDHRRRRRLSWQDTDHRSIQGVIRITAIMGELHVRQRLRSPMIHIDTRLRPQRISDRTQPKPQQLVNNKGFHGNN